MRCTFTQVKNLTSFVLMGCSTVGALYTLLLILEYPVLHGSIESEKDFQNIEYRLEQQNADDVAERRQQRVSAVCNKKNRELQTNPVPSNTTLRHLIVSKRYKTLFCYVPKVACSNWKRVFLVLEGHFNSTAEIDSRLSHESGLLQFINVYSKNEINHMLKTYKKIAFVREPMERVLSAYRNKFARDFDRKFHYRYGKKIIKKYRKNFTGEVTDDYYTTFSEFVKYVNDLKPRDKHDEHWDLQYNLCSPCDINYDFVGKYDSLKSEAALALQLMGADKVVTFPDLGTKRPGRETKTKMKTFFSQISKEEFMRLEKTYEKDYEVFEFDKPNLTEILKG